jgi:hypothetical protein
MRSTSKQKGFEKKKKKYRSSVLGSKQDETDSVTSFANFYTPLQKPRQRRGGRKLTSMRGFGAESSYQGSTMNSPSKKAAKKKLFNVKEKQMRQRKNIKLKGKRAKKSVKPKFVSGSGSMTHLNLQMSSFKIKKKR